MVGSLLFVVGKMGTISLNCLPALINVCKALCYANCCLRAKCYH